MALFPVTLNRLSPVQQALLALLAGGLLVFVVYTEFFAPKPQLRFIGSYHLDKIAHIAGGMLIAGVFEWLAPRRHLVLLMLLVAAAAVGWEGYEFFFDPDMAYFYRYLPDLWRLDTAGDIVAAFLGGYGYWTFGMKRERENLT